MDKLTKPMKKDASRNAAVERALAVLDAFDIQDRYVTLAEIARRTGVAKATLLRILPSLHDYRLICRAPDGTYYVGPTALRLAFSHNATVRSGRIIIPILSQLVERTKETATYGIRQQDSVLYIHRKNSPRHLRAHIQTGDISPLEGSAAGQIILAFQNKADEGYAALRAQMFTMRQDEMDDGLLSISCPVFDQENEIAGALSLHGPKSRLSGPRITECTRELLNAAAKVTSDFGGRASLYARAKDAEF